MKPAAPKKNEKKRKQEKKVPTTRKPATPKKPARRSIAGSVKALPEGAMLLRLPGVKIEKRDGMFVLSIVLKKGEKFDPTSFGPIAYFRPSNKFLPSHASDRTNRDDEMMAWRDILDRWKDEETGVLEPQEAADKCQVYGRPSDLQKGWFGCRQGDDCGGWCAKSARREGGATVFSCDCRAGAPPTGYDPGVGPIDS